MNSSEQIYNQSYRDKFIAQAATPLGKAIYHSRWALILRYVQNGNILDYGSGPGSFNAHGPDSFNRFNYDINPTCGFNEKAWLTGTKINHLTMWDSIEHIPDFYGTIKEINADWVFLSTPNILSIYESVETWKHTRLGEHIHHFEPVGLRVIFEDLGYEHVETNYDEGKLRDPKRPSAIVTMVFKKPWK